jgi:hypothetical protein
MATDSTKIYIGEVCWDGTDNGSSGVLSVAGNWLRLERMNIIRCWKLVTLRADECYKLLKIGCVKSGWIL